MNEPLPLDYNPTMRLPASGVHRLSPDMIRRRAGDEVEISVRDFFLACDPSPEELAEVDRKRKALGLNPLFGDDA